MINKRRGFLLASGALVSTIASPALAEAATTLLSPESKNRPMESSKPVVSAQSQSKQFKITLTYIPGLVTVGNVLSGGGADKKEKEVVIIVEADELSQIEGSYIDKNADGFFRIEGKTEIIAIPASSVTSYRITSA